MANGKPIAAFVQEGEDAGQLYYLYTDYLGSLLLTTDDQGNPLHEQNFDAWGNYRDPHTWEALPNQNQVQTTLGERGYTFHEHLPQFALINMNGRVYDPVLGRFLSPDPYVQAPTNTQNYNRYSYVLNNPLKYTDPSGEVIEIIIGFAIGAYIGGAMANDKLEFWKWDYSNPSTWIGMGVGGLIGAFGGHALAISKGGLTSPIFGNTAVKAALGAKKAFGATVGGITNTISNYDGAESFGWGTLADFAAGFGGAYAGLSAKGTAFDQWAAGFNAGGFLNAINNMVQDGVQGPIQFLQDWVGGGLSSTLGMKYGKAPSFLKPFGSSNAWAKLGNNIIKNGLTANAWDFAYSDWEKYREKAWGDHLALFAVAGIGGAYFDAAMKPSFSVDEMNLSQKLGNYVLRGSNGIIAGSITYNSIGWVKSGKFPYSKGSQQNKAEQMSIKWFLNLINL